MSSLAHPHTHHTLTLITHTHTTQSSQCCCRKTRGSRHTVRAGLHQAGLPSAQSEDGSLRAQAYGQAALAMFLPSLGTQSWADYVGLYRAYSRMDQHPYSSREYTSRTQTTSTTNVVYYASTVYKIVQLTSVYTRYSDLGCVSAVGCLQVCIPGWQDQGDPLR